MCRRERAGDCQLGKSHRGKGASYDVQICVPADY